MEVLWTRGVGGCLGCPPTHPFRLRGQKIKKKPVTTVAYLPLPVKLAPANLTSTGLGAKFRGANLIGTAEGANFTGGRGRYSVWAFLGTEQDVAASLVSGTANAHDVAASANWLPGR